MDQHSAEQAFNARPIDGFYWWFIWLTLDMVQLLRILQLLRYCQVLVFFRHWTRVTPVVITIWIKCIGILSIKRGRTILGSWCVEFGGYHFLVDIQIICSISIIMSVSSSRIVAIIEL